MRPIVEALLGTKAYFTLGYIKHDGEYQHKMNLSVLLDMLRKGLIMDPKMKLHAWITLPNMEIIDLIDSEGLGYEKNNQSDIGKQKIINLKTNLKNNYS